jgi:hypothetical protein
MSTPKITNGERTAARGKRPPARVRIREARIDDYEEILPVQLRNGLITKTRDEWTALWVGNPAYERLKADWPIGWVLESEGGEVVGSIGNIPVIYHFRGMQLRAGVSYAWAVDTPYRGYSMMILDKQTRQKSADFTLGTTVSPAAEPAFKVFRWSKAPVGTWDRSAFWITGYRGLCASYLTLNEAPMAKLASYPAALALYCRDRLRDTQPRGGSEFEIASCAGFDSRFDEFWTNLKAENFDLLLAERSSQSLQWHFRLPLAAGKATIVTASRAGKLGAYAVFDRQDNEAYLLKRVRMADFQALRGFESALPALIRWMLERCRADGVHILENVGCWLDRPGLPKIEPPYHRTLASSMFYYNCSDPALSAALSDPKAWAPTSYDGDASL